MVAGDYQRVVILLMPFRIPHTQGPTASKMLTATVLNNTRSQWWKSNPSYLVRKAYAVYTLAPLKTSCPSAADMSAFLKYICMCFYFAIPAHRIRCTLNV